MSSNLFLDLAIFTVIILFWSLLVMERIPEDKTKTYELTTTRVFNAPVERVWQAWVKPEMVKKWWGPKNFTVPVVEMDFHEGGTSLISMQAPEEMGGFVLYNTWEYTRIVPNKQLEFTLRFTDKDRKVLNPQDIGLPEGIPIKVPHVITFEGVGDKTEINYSEYGYTTNQAVEMSKAGLEEVLDKMAEALKENQ
jgi:uncharacterized protein YndB with AHSA1/START domain